MKKLIQKRLSMTRAVLTFVRYRNREKTREPPISVRIKGMKYTPSGRIRKPSTSVMAAQMTANTGPKTMAPRAFTKNATLMRRTGVMGMEICLTTSRRAIIRAANTSMWVSFSSAAASRQ